MTVLSPPLPACAGEALPPLPPLEMMIACAVSALPVTAVAVVPVAEPPAPANSFEPPPAPPVAVAVALAGPTVVTAEAFAVSRFRQCHPDLLFQKGRGSPVPPTPPAPPDPPAAVALAVAPTGLLTLVCAVALADPPAPPAPPLPAGERQNPICRVQYRRRRPPRLFPPVAVAVLLKSELTGVVAVAAPPGPPGPPLPKKGDVPADPLPPVVVTSIAHEGPQHDRSAKTETQPRNVNRNGFRTTTGMTHSYKT